MSRVRSPRQPTASSRARAPYAQRDYLAAALDQLAIGDLNVTIDVSRDPKDPLLQAAARLVAHLASTAGEQVLYGALLEKSSTTMTRTAKAVKGNTEKMSHGLAGALSATEEMRQNMTSVSVSTEELSANMQSIATNAKQSKENIESIEVSIKSSLARRATSR